MTWCVTCFRYFDHRNTFMIWPGVLGRFITSVDVAAVSANSNCPGHDRHKIKIFSGIGMRQITQNMPQNQK